MKALSATPSSPLYHHLTTQPVSSKIFCLSWLLLSPTQPNKGTELPLIRYPSTFSYSYSNSFLILKQNQELKAKRFSTSDILTFSDSLLVSHRAAWPRPPEIVEIDGTVLVVAYNNESNIL